MRKTFYRSLNSYHPLRFEKIHEENFLIETDNTHYAVLNRRRFFLVLDYFLSHFALNDAVIADFGAYPGTFLRLLHRFASIDNGQLYGLGLNVSPEFMAEMVRDCNATIFEVNLDPANPDIAGRGFKQIIPLDEGSVHYIYAGEVIEHMVNPSWMLQEAYRILKPGGQMVITTPNVCRIGNIFKLLIGRTNYDRLQPIGNQKADDEWRAHFREYALKELVGIFEKYGFNIKSGRHYNSQGTVRMNMDRRTAMIEMCKTPFYLAPHLRGDIFAVFEKKRTT